MRDLVTRDGALGGHLDSIAVELLQRDGIHVVDFFRVVYRSKRSYDYYSQAGLGLGLGGRA